MGIIDDLSYVLAIDWHYHHSETGLWIQVHEMYFLDLLILAAKEVGFKE